MVLDLQSVQARSPLPLDGVGGTHRTTYGYQGRGWLSTRNWGFHGFSATGRTDEASGVSKYTQYRLDFPH